MPPPRTAAPGATRPASIQPPGLAAPLLSLEEAARCLEAGGIVLFPTETLYALGCRADKPEACARLCALKRRPQGSPLPLLAADTAQAALAVQLEAAPPALTETFWPGPLSLLLPGRPHIAPQARNAAGLAALRVTPHPLAARLARLAGGALTASSANFSGHAPASRLADVDAALLDALGRLARGDGSAGACRAETLRAGMLPARTPLAGILAASADAEPAGGPPSTLVQPLWRQAGATPGRVPLRLLREGAIPAAALVAAGFALRP